MKLADFGLSRSLPHSHLLEEIHQHRGEYLPEMRDNDRSLTMGIGTPTYISPELLKKHGDGRCTYTAMADIFSLGALLGSSPCIEHCVHLQVSSCARCSTRLRQEWSALEC